MDATAVFRQLAWRQMVCAQLGRASFSLEERNDQT
jgi:hypothetical protein